METVNTEKLAQLRASLLALAALQRQLRTALKTAQASMNASAFARHLGLSDGLRRTFERFLSGESVLTSSSLVGELGRGLHQETLAQQIQELLGHFTTDRMVGLALCNEDTINLVFDLLVAQKFYGNSTRKFAGLFGADAKNVLKVFVLARGSILRLGKEPALSRVRRVLADISSGGASPPTISPPDFVPKDEQHVRALLASFNGILNSLAWHFEQLGIPAEGLLDAERNTILRSVVRLLKATHIDAAAIARLQRREPLTMADLLTFGLLVKVDQPNQRKGGASNE